MYRFALLALMAFVAAGTQAAGLEVSNGWIRLLPAGVPAGGYFELRNNAGTPAELIGVSSPAFGRAMLHRTVEDKGRSTMMHVDKVKVPAGGNVVFRPGGYHVMLMKPMRELHIGDKAPVTLEFASGEKLTAQFEVRGPSGK